jgi:hypothetical protein
MRGFAMSFTLRRALMLAGMLLVAAFLLRTLDGGPAGASEAPPTTDPAASFAVLASTMTADDVIAPTERRGLAEIADREGVDLSTARAVPSAVADGDVRLVPGPDRVCVTIPDPTDGDGVACATAEQAAHGRLWTALTGMPGQEVGDARAAIVVPDGVDTITAVATDGTRRTLIAHDNLVVADLTDSAGYEVTVDGETATVPLPGTPASLASD